MSRMRLTLLLLALRCLESAHAQFGPHNFAFDSEVKYPGRMLSGDVDQDGDVDVLIQFPGSTDTPTGVYLWRNLGAGLFGDREWIYAGFVLNNGTVLKIADVDDDGDGDLVQNATWYRNNGTGQLFTNMGGYAPASTTAAGLLEDLDGDGDLDDVGRTATNAVLLLNDGTGAFSVGASIGPAGASTSIAADLADVNGDLIADLVIGGDNAQEGWYAGLGAGAFGARDSIPTFGNGATPDLGDMDNDGDADLLAFGVAPGVRWWSNDGAGAFTLMDTVSTTATRPEMVDDVDGDGDMDLSLSTGTSCNVHLSSMGAGFVWSTMVVENFSGYSLQGTRYASGDMDGDGDQDLLFCQGLGMAGWYPNNNGTIGARQRFAKVLGSARDIAAADVDLDGDLDLAAPSLYGDWVTLYHNNGDGTFGPQQVIVENRNAISMARFADLDADGLPDLITNVASCAVIWNNGASWTPDTLPGQSIASQAMDVDGDLDLDLICTGQWLRNDGNGAFTAVADADLPVFTALDTADVDGNGAPDLVAGGANTITALLNDGNGDFTPLTSAGFGYKLDLADMDGDGDVDVASMGSGTQVCIYLNDGTGSFTGGVQYDHPVGVSNHILATDFDGDGDTDVIWAHSNGYQHETYVHRNLGPATLGPAELTDPAAEVTMAMILADMDNDAVLDLVHARFHSISWKENLWYNAFRLRGSVFIDFDLDATLDSAEFKVPFRLVRTDANDVLVWTNSAGDYDLPADTGTWKAWHTPLSSYQVTNDPDTLLATLTTQDPIASGLDIGLAPAQQDSSNFLSITYSGPFRCNTSVVAWIHLRNTGTFIPEGIVIDYQVHPDLVVSGAWPTPDSIVGGHFYWSVDSLGWFQEFQAVLQIQMGPAGSYAGFGHSVTAANMPLHYEQPLVPFNVNCAFDPNDKLVTPQGFGAAGAVPIDQEWLEYTVRFQNTGTDTAFTVQLLDTLDFDLDPLSMEVLAASHPLTRIQVDANNVALFRFERILLPDSNVNEPASHGFVKYRIKPVAGSPHLTEVTNSAAIYFDLNAPVITNTVLNTLVDCGLHSATITDMGGGLLEATEGDHYQWFLNGDTLTGDTLQQLTVPMNGDYTVQVTTVHGCVDTSDPYTYVTTTLAGTGGGPLLIQPNPMRSTVRITATRTLTAADLIELVDPQGRIVRSWAGQGTQVMTIERGDIASGLYMLRISDVGTVRLVVE